MSEVVARNARRVIELVGNQEILLPVERATKRCRVPGWPKVRLQDTCKVQYQQLLAAGNIAVRLGKPTGLCTIDIDDDDLIELFMEFNPWMRGTLRTRGARGCAVWFRIAGDFPSTGRLVGEQGHVGELRTTNSYQVIYGTHPVTKQPYTVLNAAPVVEITWKDVAWPTGVQFAESKAFAQFAGGDIDNAEFSELRVKVDAFMGVGNEADWYGFNMGFIECPGAADHSTSDGHRDCAVLLGGDLKVGVKCCHQSCARSVGLFATKMRTAIVGDPDEIEEAVMASVPVRELSSVGKGGSGVNITEREDEEDLDDVDKKLRAAEKLKVERDARQVIEKAAIEQALKDIFFDGRDFWSKHENKWMHYSADNIGLKLNGLGLSSKVPRGRAISPSGAAKLAIIEGNRITGGLPLFHQPEVVWQNGNKFLNTSTIELIKPIYKASPVAWGDGFEWIGSYLKQLFIDETQLHVFLAWLKRYYEGCVKQARRLGQVMVIVGGVHVGKTLLVKRIIGGLLGGVANAAPYLLGDENQFTSDLFASPVWMVDDATPAADPRKKARYTAMLKKLSADTTFKYEKKYKESITTEWAGRIIVTLNGDPTSLENLPSIESSNLDKTIMLRCADSVISFPPNDVLEPMIEKELAAFGAWLLDWQPPVGIVAGTRYGVISYHDDFIKESAANSSDSSYFAEALDDMMGAWFSEAANKKAESWAGRVTDLVRLAQGVAGDGEHSQLFKDFKPVMFGRFLKKLISTGSQRYAIKYHGGSAYKPWEICRK